MKTEHKNLIITFILGAVIALTAIHIRFVYQLQATVEQNKNNIISISTFLNIR